VHCNPGRLKDRLKSRSPSCPVKASSLQLSPSEHAAFSGNASQGDAVAACAAASTLYRNISCCRNIWISVLPFFAVTRVDLTIDSLQITADALSSVQRPRLFAAIIRRQHVYEVRPRKDKCGVNLISDVLPLGVSKRGRSRIPLLLFPGRRCVSLAPFWFPVTPRLCPFRGSFTGICCFRWRFPSCPRRGFSLKFSTAGRGFCFLWSGSSAPLFSGSAARGFCLLGSGSPTPLFSGRWARSPLTFAR
jgi:hypothetical protein